MRQLRAIVIPILTIVFFIFQVDCFAENLPDPTRPPIWGNVKGTGIELSQGPILQSILISPQRRVAVISGQTVLLGETYGGARIISINETSIVLKKGSKLETLRLFPEVRKSVY